MQTPIRSRSLFEVQVAPRQRFQPKPLGELRARLPQAAVGAATGRSTGALGGSAAEAKSVATNRLSTRGAAVEKKPALQCRGASGGCCYFSAVAERRTTQRKRALPVGACDFTRSLRSGGLAAAGLK
ncbi:hypothetical protein MRX96_047575 [Rhipicephalus microplus]